MIGSTAHSESSTGPVRRGYGRRRVRPVVRTRGDGPPRSVMVSPPVSSQRRAKRAKRAILAKGGDGLSCAVGLKTRAGVRRCVHARGDGHGRRWRRLDGPSIRGRLVAIARTGPALSATPNLHGVVMGRSHMFHTPTDASSEPQAPSRRRSLTGQMGQTVHRPSRPRGPAVATGGIAAAFGTLTLGRTTLAGNMASRAVADGLEAV